MTTDTTERGLKRLICTALAGHPCEPIKPGTVAKPPAAYGGVGWCAGYAEDYDREYCVDLIQHSAGSGKSNSIAWLAHQLIGLAAVGSGDGATVFDSIIVVTDRRILDKQNARIEHDKALLRVMTNLIQDDTELFKQFMDDESFKRWMTDTVFGLTYDKAGEGAGA
jgi:hypothetical protein